MNSEPFFSVVIALYNKEDYIEATLKSVLNQTYKNFEVVIINDGSTDTSVNIVNSIKNEKVKLFNIPNHGASFARNYGIKKSRANYIAFLDADDLWENNHLATLYNLILEFPYAGMYSTGYQIQINNNIKKTKLKGIPYRFKGEITDYFKYNLYNSIVNSSVVAIPKHVLEYFDGFDTNIKSGQDTYLWTQIGIKHKVAINNIVTATIIKGDNSLSNSQFIKDRALFLDKFISQEKNNLSLKQFMDMNRYSVAISFKMCGKNALSRSIYKNIDLHNLSIKQKLVYALPSKLLLLLFNFKKFLDKQGVFLNLYR